MAAERMKLDQEQARNREAQAKIDAERKAFEAEKAELAHKQEIEAAKVRAVEEAKEAERVRIARADAKAKAEAEAAVREAAARPVREQLTVFAGWIRDAKVPFEGDLGDRVSGILAEAARGIQSLEVK